MNHTWNAEDIFIQLIVENGSLTLEEIEQANKFARDMESSNSEFSPMPSYMKWLDVKNKYMDYLTLTETVSCSYFTGTINSNEVEALEYKLLHHESELLSRLYNVQYNEAVHAADELSDR